MIALDAAEIARITGGTLCGLADSPTDQLPVIDHVTTDSREVRPGTLFVAKPGEITDGHRFVSTAFDAGAVLALVEHEVRDEAGAVFPSVCVADVVEAMGTLAAWVVEHVRNHHAALGHEVKVIGVTGSVGKTTTKDLLRAIFESVGPTVAPQGSYNGEVGVPLTVFTATENTQYFVVEMGATHVGNIKYLCDMVKPDVGVVLCVGNAHAGEFGGVENIAVAKGELVEALSGDGVAVLNADDYRVRDMHSRTQAPVMFFGAGNHEELPTQTQWVRASDVQLNDHGHPTFTLHFPDGSEHRITSGLIGAHHVTNILAAATAAYAANISAEHIASVVQKLGAGSRWRMERTERADGVTVINDAYNANPQSMRAALQTLADLGRETKDRPARRTWAVLGGMLELGDLSVPEHDAIGRYVVRMNISKLVAVGQAARPMYDAAHLEGSWGNEATWVQDAHTARELLDKELTCGDIVLFKSSNAAGLKNLGDEIARSRVEVVGEPAAAHDSPAADDHWLSAGDFVNADRASQSLNEGEDA